MVHPVALSIYRILNRDMREDGHMARLKKMHPGSCALVTGATGGIGKELCENLARQKEHETIALVGRNNTELKALANSLQKKYGVKTCVLIADFSKPDGVEKLVSKVRGANLVVETLVNNAGFGYDANFVDSDAKRQQALVQTNVMALMDLCLAFVPDMAKRKHGNVLNVASVAGFLPGPRMATYYASKAFVQSFSNALHMELRFHGVHVTALCPGPVRTPFWDRADAEKTAIAHMTMSPSVVASSALLALKLNRMLCSPGLFAKTIVFSSRLLPRSWAGTIAAALQTPKE